MGFAPQILHCNDWHTGLGPLLLRTVYAWDQLFHGTRSLMSIHNIAYQGVFDARRDADTGASATSAHLLDASDLRRRPRSIRCAKASRMPTTSAR